MIDFVDLNLFDGVAAMKKETRLLLTATLASILLQAATVFSFVGLTSVPGLWRWIPVVAFLALSFGLLLWVRVRLRFREAFLYCLLVSTCFALLLEALGWTVYRGLRHNIEPFSLDHGATLVYSFSIALAASAAALLAFETSMSVARRINRKN